MPRTLVLLLAAACTLCNVCYGQSELKPAERRCPVENVFATAYALGLEPVASNEASADCEPWLSERAGHYLVYASGPISDDPEHLKVVLAIIDDRGSIVARLQKPWIIDKSLRRSEDRNDDSNGWVQPTAVHVLVSDLSPYEISSGHFAFGIRIITGPDDDQTVVSRTQTTLLLFDIDGENIREIMSGLIVRREGFTNGGKAECDVRYRKGKTSLQMITRKNAYSTGMVEYNYFSNHGYNEFSKCDPAPQVAPRKVYFMRTVNGIFLPPKELRDFRFSTTAD